MPILDNAQGELLSVGRKTRVIPTALRRALKNRDKGCRFPGCPATRWVDGHHIEHWADGGETSLDNLVLLCRFHHRMLHEGGFDIQVCNDGARRFIRPDGSVLPESYPPVLSDTSIEALNRELGLEIDKATCQSKWLGESMDYSSAVGELLEAAERHAAKTKDVAAETSPCTG